ncbi:DUF3556 domain-containing protein [Spongisporangium articulatum]|uniref:DUF3556 domain-containing protein n=1 Tax=Spongisporangium articulatum TaxID=3362603 RepID=A0ABW8AJ04_9ACTN
MGFIKPSPQPVEPAEFLVLPLRERMRTLSTTWVEDGFGTPRVLHVIYILKMFGLYLGGGLLIAAATSNATVFEPGSWWDNIVVYQKLAAWLMLLELIGLGGAWGPLCGHFKPMTGNIRYWLRPGTIRMAPWGSRVPGTAGDTRTLLDVGLYLAALAGLVVPLAASGVDVVGVAGQQVVPGWAFVPVLVLMPLLGLRDKVIFLAGRSEQYLPIMLYSAVFADDFTNLVVAYKIVIVCVWIGAGVSKIGDHFVNVVPPMVSNSPAMPGKASRRLFYRDFPRDLRPSRLAWFMAHIGGTLVEIAIPVTLLLTTNATIALLGAVAMLLFHLFITSTFPLAVPLEWNVFFGFAAITLWVGKDPSAYSIYDFSPAWALLPIFALALAFPVLGNLRPDLVSFLPSMRQYAGNWASAVWAMKPGVEERLNELPNVHNQVDQLVEMKYEPDDAEMTLQKTIAWRTMHSQGRGLFSALYHHLDDIEERTVREGELVCNTLVGWNFGDGHLHDHRLVAAVQRRLGLQPGDLVVVWVESQPIFRHTQAYQVIDAALGVVERGTWDVRDCVAEQPWLPNGPVDLDVTWAAPGYQRRRTLTARTFEHPA